MCEGTVGLKMQEKGMRAGEKEAGKRDVGKWISAGG